MKRRSEGPLQVQKSQQIGSSRNHLKSIAIGLWNIENPIQIPYDIKKKQEKPTIRIILCRILGLLDSVFGLMGIGAYIVATKCPTINSQRSRHMLFSTLLSWMIKTSSPNNRLKTGSNRQEKYDKSLMRFWGFPAF